MQYGQPKEELWVTAKVMYLKYMLFLKSYKKHYQYAVCRMKTCNWTLTNGAAYNKAYKSVAQSRSQSGRKAFNVASKEAHTFFMHPRLAGDTGMSI
jgi:hypothetical protein